MGKEAQSGLKFFDDIEKLRGFACILVLLQHIIWICPYYFVINVIPDCFSIGSGAVHIFFAISGFVITYSLADKLDKAKGDFLSKLNNAKDWLLSFYVKRFFRIFPMVFVVMIILGGFFQLTSEKTDWQLPLLRMPFEILLGTYNNVVDLFVSKNIIYCSGIGPFWTLAVESQFYMLWPLVLLFCKNNNQRAFVSLSLGLICSFIITPVSNYFFGSHYYWTINNIAELFLGSFLAYIYKEGFEFNISKCKARSLSIFFVFLIWFYPSAVTGLKELFMTEIIQTFFSVFLVALCVFTEGSFSFGGLNHIFKYLGKRSFSFYSVQLSLANIVIWSTGYIDSKELSRDEFLFYQFLIFITVLFVVTELLYRFIERPSRKLGR